MVKLVKAGFRKDRAILTVFLLIIVISSFLLHTGLFASMYPKLYDDYASEQGLCDYVMWTSADYDRIDSIFSDANGIKSYTAQDTVNIPSIKVTTN